MSAMERIPITPAFLREQLEDAYRRGYAHGYEVGRVDEMAGRPVDKRISWERDEGKAAATAENEKVPVE